LPVSFVDITSRHKIIKLNKEIEIGKFVINRHGVFFKDVLDEVEERILVCSSLVVNGITRNKDANDWGKLLLFIDLEGNEKQYHMSSSKAQNIVISDLVHRGVVIFIKWSFTSSSGSVPSLYGVTKNDSCQAQCRDG
jgi:hypothetical protein